MLKKKLTWVLILLLLIGISAGYLILNSNDKAMEQLVNMNYTEEEAKQIKDLGIANDVIAFGDSDLFETAFRQNKVTKGNYKRYLKANDSLPSGYSMDEVIANMDAMAAQGYTDEEGFSLMSRYGKDVAGQLFSYPKPEKLDTVLKLVDKGYSVEQSIKLSGESTDIIDLLIGEDADYELLSTLQEKGYTLSETVNIMKSIPSEYHELLKKMKYLPNLEKLAFEEGFKFDLLPRYILAIQYNSKTPCEAVSWVNANGDYVSANSVNYSGLYHDEKEVKDPTSITVYVNKQNYLPSDYVPADLVDLPSGYYGNDQPMRKEAADALIKLSDDAVAAGYSRVYGQSNYRSYALQNSLYKRYSANSGTAGADRYSARPGFSEHQTGLAADLGGGVYSMSDFQYFPGYKWVCQNAHKYGFIQRYQSGKEFLTGFQYESWHFRYVGVEAATIMYEHDWTLDEYVVLFDN